MKLVKSTESPQGRVVRSTVHVLTSMWVTSSVAKNGSTVYTATTLFYPHALAEHNWSNSRKHAWRLTP
jgi:hypothetical protein